MTPDRFRRGLLCTQLWDCYEQFNEDPEFPGRIIGVSYAAQNKDGESHFTHVWRFHVRMDDLDDQNPVYELIHTCQTDTYELHPTVKRAAVVELLKVYAEAVEKARGPQLVTN